MISFDVKGVTMPDLDYDKVRKWLCEVASGYDKKTGNLNYLFCDDETILETNRKFLNHDYYTDIITFDYTHKDKLGGDLFISLDTVRSNAEEIGQPYKQELLRVIVHGLLHLCGINDKLPGEREIMEAEENKALALWSSIMM